MIRTIRPSHTLRALGARCAPPLLAALALLLLAPPPPARAEGRTGLLFEGTFESGDLTGFYWHQNQPQVVPADAHPVRAGRYAMRCYLHRHDSAYAYRTEVIAGSRDTNPPATKDPFYMAAGGEYWVGFSTFVPQDMVVDRPHVEDIVFQMQASPDPGEDYRSPVFALNVDEDRWMIVVRWDARRDSGSGNSFEGSEKVYQAPLGPSLGAWTDWVIHVVWSHTDGGLLEVWRDAERVVHRQGPNTANDAVGPHLAIGLYKWSWRPEYADLASNTDWRLFYHDEFRIGGADASYADVAPGDAAPAPAQPTPTPQPTPAPSEPTPAPTPPPPAPGEIVVDDADPGLDLTWEQDAWEPWVDTAGQSWNGAHYYNRAIGSGKDVATWRFTVPQGGLYDVYAWWWPSPNRPTDVPYTVHHRDGEDTVRVNQQTGGGQWNLLGTYTFSGEGAVSVSDAATNGRNLVADAVRLVPVVEVSDPGATPERTPTDPPTLTPEPTLTDPPTPSPQPTATAAPTATPSPTAQPTPTASATPSPTHAAVPTPEPSSTPSPTAEATPTSAPTATPPAAAGPDEVIVDDSDPGFDVVEGEDAWQSSTGANPGGYGPVHRYNRSVGSGADVATWTFALPRPGRYEVYAWWPSKPYRPTDVPYTIEHHGGSTTVRVSQNTGGGEWHLLGAFDFEGGGAVSVSDGATDGRDVVADAIRLLRVGDAAPTPEPTAEERATETPGPTAEPATPTATPATSPTPEPTAVAPPPTVAPTEPEPTPVPSATPLPSATQTATPTEPAPTAAPTSTPTPVPTPTPAPVPTATPEPGPTPQPSPTPEPTATPTDPLAPADLVIDDGDAGFGVSSQQDDWVEWPDPDGQSYNARHRYNRAIGSGGDVATWQFSLERPGRYNVYAWWPESPNRPTDVPYTVHHRDGENTIRVNQQTGGGQWHLLGTFAFEGGGAVSVSDAATDGRNLVADAVRLEYAGE